MGAGLLSWVWQAEQQRRSSRHIVSRLPVIAGLIVVTVTLLLWQVLRVRQQSVPAAARTVLPTVLLGAGLLIAIFMMVEVRRLSTLGAAAYCVKPSALAEYLALIQRIVGFWGRLARLTRE